MKRKKIYFFTEFPFKKRDFLRFGFDIFRENNLEVFVIDFTPLFLKNFKELNLDVKKNKREKYYFIQQKKDFNDIESFFDSNSIIISLFKIKPKTKFVFEFLNERKVLFGFCNSNLVPSNEKSIKEKFLQSFKNPKTILNKLDFLFSSYKNKVSNNIYPKFIISGGKKSVDSDKYPQNKDTILIETHTLDYDLYLDEELKNKERSIESNYVVFLDEYVPYHPDYIHQNIEPYCSPDDYYSDLNLFFSEIEFKTEFRVIICAHPKADYKKIGNLFNDRTIFYDQTINLVKFSEFVITHASTSSNFAVLYKKPMVFIKSKKYDSAFNKIIDFHASIFKKKPIDVSFNGEKFHSEERIDKDTYKSYKIDYIKNINTPQKKVWNIFLDNLDSLN